MANYITVDGGTTNTRVYLVSDGRIVNYIKFKMGARDCIKGGAEYRARLSSAIESLLCDNRMERAAVSAVILSGMLTSEYGLCPVDHLVAPVGAAELHRGMKKCKIEGVEIPCYFIPGVKIGTDELSMADMMRGEETEIIGLSSNLKEQVYVLPGSHSKHVRLDGSGRICDITTFMTGEMLSALSEGTILKDAVSLNACNISAEHLVSGCLMAEHEGISAALFKTRILKNLFSADASACYSFFLGAILSPEIILLEKRGLDVAIGGKSLLRDPMKLLLDLRGKLKVSTFSDDETNCATAIGAVRIFEHA